MISKEDFRRLKYFADSGACDCYFDSSTCNNNDCILRRFTNKRNLGELCNCINHDDRGKKRQEFCKLVLKTLGVDRYDK
jgi:hypothetical protein